MPTFDFDTRRFARRVLRAVALCAALLWSAAAVTAYATYSATDIPGGTVTASNLSYRLRPYLAVRRDAVYRSRDRFNTVYTWYSRRFNLGTERHATGTCNVIAYSGHVFASLDQSMSVMMCDTPEGPMAFVTRTLSIRYPDWLRAALSDI